MGNSIVRGITSGASQQEAKAPQTQGQGPWSDINYRNGADVQDDLARQQRERVAFIDAGRDMMGPEADIWGQPQTVANSYPVTSGPVESRDLPRRTVGLTPDEKAALDLADRFAPQKAASKTPPPQAPNKTAVPPINAGADDYSNESKRLSNYKPETPWAFAQRVMSLNGGVSTNKPIITQTIYEERLVYTGKTREEWRPIDWDDPSLNKNFSVDAMNLIPNVAKWLPGFEVKVEGVTQRGERLYEARVDKQYYRIGVADQVELSRVPLNYVQGNSVRWVSSPSGPETIYRNQIQSSVGPLSTEWKK